MTSLWPLQLGHGQPGLLPLSCMHAWDGMVWSGTHHFSEVKGPNGAYLLLRFNMKRNIKPAIENYNVDDILFVMMMLFLGSSVHVYK